jgi:hypothetical protein
MNKHVDKIKTHFQENKRAYAIAGSCLVIGAAIGAIIVAILAAKNDAANNAEIDVENLFCWKPITNSEIVQIHIPMPGNSGNAVQCVETGTVYASQNEAARAMNVDRATVSRHMNGLIDFVDGFTLRKLTENGVPLA